MSVLVQLKLFIKTWLKLQSFQFCFRENIIYYQDYYHFVAQWISSTFAVYVYFRFTSGVLTEHEQTLYSNLVIHTKIVLSIEVQMVLKDSRRYNYYWNLYWPLEMNTEPHLVYFNGCFLFAFNSSLWSAYLHGKCTTVRILGKIFCLYYFHRTRCLVILV